MQVRFKISIILLFIAIVSGYLVIWLRYYYGYLSLNQYVSLTIAVTLVLPALLLLLRNNYPESTYLGINLKKVVWFLPLFLLLSAILELRLLEYMGLFTVVVLVMGLSLLALSKLKGDLTSIASLLLALIICVLYGVYIPSFGNDTWRDVIWASQIIVRGGLRALTVNHPAYPLPVVPILYAVYSVVAGLNTLWSSSFIGLTYLFLLPLWVYIIAKRFNTEHPHVSAILLLSTPLVVIWSVWFIPQTYAILAAIPLLSLELPPMLILIFSAAMIFGHGGVSLWTVILLTSLVFAKRIFKVRANVLRSIDIKFIIVALLFISYATYTTLSMVLKGSVNSAIEAITNFIAGERNIESTPPIQRPPSSVLGAVPVIVLAVLGALVLLGHRTALIRLLAFFSLAGLGVAYIGAATSPALDLPRYVGLESAVLLAILSSHGVEVLTRRGRPGALYALLLILFAIVSFGFSGTMMPGNPYTANPYSTWSISGLITYDEAKMLDDIGSLVCHNNYLVDWRAGAYLEYKYLWIQPRFRGFYNPETQSSFMFAGSYGLYVTPEYLTEYHGLLIFRKMALSMPEAFSPELKEFLYNTICNGSILYDSTLIKIYCFT